MIRSRFLYALLLPAVLLGGVLGTRRVLPPRPAATAHGRVAVRWASPEPGRVTEAQAITTAVNQLEAGSAGWHLRHPRHTADFTPGGVRFVPRGGGPAWSWTLTWVGTADQKLPGVDTDPVRPVVEQAQTIAYPRGALIEQYVPRGESLEQQFVLLTPPAMGGADLVIAGRVDSLGVFETLPNGWQWQTEAGAVTLGQVRVFDAHGRALPATMAVSAGSTQIVLDGRALALAAYPVTVDPQIGANDFRLSDMGPDGSTAYGANEPDVAYNSTNNEYLVVWRGDDDTGPLVQGEFEIFGQRVNAATGAEIGGDFRLSDMGPDGDTDYGAFEPVVAYNSTSNQYLVVWYGDDDTGDLVASEFEVYGQRVNAATGAEIGGDIRLSNVGADGDSDHGALSPAVAYNSTNQEYLVVWYRKPVLFVDDEIEIFGQRVNAAGAEVGANDFQLSDMGPAGSSNYSAILPAVAYNSTNNEYLVVWRANDDTGSLAQGELEIFGQRVNAATGAEVGTDDFRLSDMGPDGNASYGADLPAVAYNSTNNQYLVVWHGDDNTSPLVQGEHEIFGQRVNAATGAEIGGDFRLSDMGPDGSTAYAAFSPSVAYNNTNNQYLVVWYGDDNTGGVVNEEFEIYGQWVNAATGAAIGLNDFRVSDMGPDGNSQYGVDGPAVAYNSTNNQGLVVWDGNDNTGSLAQFEFEIFGQRVAPDKLLFLPLLMR
ncbi:MAG: hypothetical protein ABI847_05885 [Anaerolineales bacterium]